MRPGGWVGLGVTLLGLSAFSLAHEPPAERRGDGGLDETRLIRLVRQDCGSCHGMTLKGGLGKPLTREALAGQSAQALAVIILHGKHGTAMPPWQSLLSEQEAHWIAQQLLAGFPEESRP
jgi:cytochrome c55X